MALSDRVVVRLIVWEGVLRSGPMQQKQIKAHSEVLKRLINQCVGETPWRFQMWKVYNSESTETQKFEVRIRHPNVNTSEERNEAIHQLCEKLLSSELPTELRLQYPTVSFTFSPSREGTIATVDDIFARCFSTAVVTRYCVGTTYSKEMEKMRDEFLMRNSTKYLYQPMFAMYTVADLADRYDVLILTLVEAVELLNGDKRSSAQLATTASKLMSEKVKENLHSPQSKKLADQMFHAATESVKSKLPKSEDDAEDEKKKAKTSSNLDEKAQFLQNSIEENKEAMKLSIAVACQLVRAFVGFSAEIKQELGPKLKELNGAIIEARLALAREAYMGASRAPIDALEFLHGQDRPTIDDIAMTINSFGTLMQSTLPLFDITLNITDKEFATVSTLVAGASVGLLATGGAGLWMWTAGAATGPVGLLAVTGISTLALGTAAIREGLKWGERQKNNPTTSLITIQKVMEECARFLLALLFIQAEMSPSDDATHLERVQQLKSQLSSGFATNKNYQKAYFKNTAIQLAKEMKALEVGLENGTV